MSLQNTISRSLRSGARGAVVAIAFAALPITTSLHAAPPPGYYDSVDTSSSAALRATLHEVIDDHTRYPYTSSSTDTWDILEDAQQDPANSSKIIEVYGNQSITKIGGGTGPYNREHSWPKSYGFPDDNPDNYPYTDCFQLFLCDSGYNSTRSNKPFRNCSPGCQEETTVFNNGQGGGSGAYPGNSNWTSGNFTLGTWEVWSGRRGDIARAQFYLDVRYEGGTHGITGAAEPDLILTDNESLIDSSNTGQNRSVAYMGMLSVLLQWHLEDPVDDWERNRNDVVASYQGNRNPFIDHPEWVECIFNGVCGGTGGTIDAPVGLAAAAGDGLVSLSWNDNTEPDLDGYNVYRSTTMGGPYAQLNGALVGVSSYNDTTVVNGTTYFYVVTAVNTMATESANSAEVSATPQTSSGNSPAAPTGLSAVAGDGSVSLTWFANSEPDLGGYNVYRSTVSGGPYAQLNGALIATNAYNDTTVTNGVTYFFVVTAVNTSLDESPDSNQASATPQANMGGNAGPPWINEIHYDNNGGDTGEFLEIAGAAGTNLSGWRVIGYNGNGGVTYDEIALSGIIPDQGGCMGTLAFDFVGMQNGAPDGLALVDSSDNVIQFISYEGSLTATNGLATGMTSTDIGVSEQPAPPIGDSLQLSGNGSAYEDFVWQAAAANTSGAVNTGQSFNGCSTSDTTPPDAPTNLTATAANATVILAWNASAASDLAGYNVYRSQTPGGPYTQLNGALVVSNGLLDNTAANCTTYHFVVTAVDTSDNESSMSNEASATPSAAGAGAADCDGNQIPDDCQADSDNDGLIDACDLCPNDINKIAPGDCGCGVADTDSDNDGTPDCNDLCPNDINKIAPGDCGCGVADTDSDNDGTPDCNDLCPNDINKIAPGDCGCGVADTDSDNDGTPDCNDLCPNDINKIAPGDCGCGVADTDSDNDGTPDCNDLCPNDINKIAPGNCGCGVADTDSDNDGTPDCNDLCPNDINKIAPGDCGCGVADTDSDNDGTPDCNDLCPNDINKIAPGNCGCGNPDVADGDINEDGSVDGRDIQAFASALTSGSPSAAALCHGDFDNLNGVDAADIAPMIDALLAP